MSVSTHDFRRCFCGALAVDGGPDYLRREVRSAANFIDTSIFIPVTLDHGTAANYLGVLSAFERPFGPGRHVLATPGIMQACREQEAEKPWFHAPKNLEALRKQLRQLEEWGHVEGCYRNETTRLYWRSKVELAPWPGQAQNRYERGALKGEPYLRSGPPGSRRVKPRRPCALPDAPVQAACSPAPSSASRIAQPTRSTS